MKTRWASLSITTALVVAALGADVAGEEVSDTVLSPQALQEIAQVEAEVDRIEFQTLARLASPLDNEVQQVELLGKLMLYDKQLSVNRNEACAFCWRACSSRPASRSRRRAIRGSNSPFSITPSA